MATYLTKVQLATQLSCSINRLPSLENKNIVFIGHVDSGKSTLTGHLLVLMGYVSQSVIKKNEAECKTHDKQTFQFAYVTDTDETERARGLTINVCYKNFESDKYHYTVIDAPGHQDFVPNMIAGTACADIGILVVDSSKGKFESGFEKGGQTKEHALLAKTNGLKNLIVAVNKMDNCGWSQERFEEIVKEVQSFLNSIGYKDEQLQFVPISGFKGLNLVKRLEGDELDWYKGGCLLEALDSVEKSHTELKMPLRLIVKENDNHLLCFCEAGVLYSGKTYVVLPADLKATVKLINFHGKKRDFLMAGEVGTIEFKEKGLYEQIQVGSIICPVNFPIPRAKSVRVKIMTFNLTIPMARGQSMFVHLNTAKVPARFKSFEALLKDNKPVKKNPK